MLSDLKNCQSIYDIASLLEIQPKHLTFLLYVLPKSSRYSTACLSKKNGKTRNILIPNTRLKILQRQLSDVLYECTSELDKRHGARRSFGFEKNRTIYDNANQHVGKRWVFNIDIEDFFPSINFGRVIGYFKSNKEFQLQPKVATLIAQIACHDNQLPQGAPSSPIISNLIAGSLDFRLSRFARKQRCNYSRYVDDITFSTNQRNFPDAISIKDNSTMGWCVGDELRKRIEDAGFQLNQSKTRMSYRRSRQVVTGLVVNKEPAVPREHYKNSRAAIHHIMRGKEWHVERFDETFAWNCEQSPPDTDKYAMLEGRMAFIHSISDRNDKRPSDKKFFRPTAVSKTYANLLYFKHFVRGSRPIILTEGVSDILYLKGAALWAKADIPGLVVYNPIEDNELLFDFYNFPKRTGPLMGLTGGTAKLKLFLERYHVFLGKLSTNVPRRPFIILIDNDKGLDAIESLVLERFGTDISRSQNKPFYKISSNTYIVKTPHLGAKKKTASEDFLDPKALSEVLNGKTFSSKTNYDKNNHYGKFILGSHILKNLGSFSFTKFNPVMNRLRDAVADASS